MVEVTVFCDGHGCREGVRCRHNPDQQWRVTMGNLEGGVTVSTIFALPRGWTRRHGNQTGGARWILCPACTFKRLTEGKLSEDGELNPAP